MASAIRSIEIIIQFKLNSINPNEKWCSLKQKFRTVKINFKLNFSTLNAPRMQTAVFNGSKGARCWAVPMGAFKGYRKSNVIDLVSNDFDNGY